MTHTTTNVETRGDMLQRLEPLLMAFFQWREERAPDAIPVALGSAMTGFTEYYYEALGFAGAHNVEAEACGFFANRVNHVYRCINILRAKHKVRVYLPGEPPADDTGWLVIPWREIQRCFGSGSISLPYSETD